MATAEVAETVAEHIEDVAEVTRSVTNGDIRIAVLAGVVGLSGGIAIGYFLTKNKVEKKYLEFADNEIREMKEYYEKREELRQDKPALDKVVTDLGYKTQEARETPEVQVPSPEAEVPQETRNVFTTPVVDAPSAEWDYATEAANRDHDGPPYIIHADEFKENEYSFDQVQYTYYEDDDVLCDPRDNMITNIDDVVGLENLQKFGHGSGDPSIVYVRNAKLELEFEISRNPGSFSEQVQGVLKHSEDFSRRRKARFDDDPRR